MTSRRACLAGWEFQSGLHPNAGLWMDKFIQDQAAENITGKSGLVSEVSKILVPEVYFKWFECWRATLITYGVVCRSAIVDGSMIIGLGNESVLETSIALHRVFGVPCIPGSALKGMAARYARDNLSDEWQAKTRQQGESVSPYEVVFGSTDTAGYVTFFDALPYPDSCLLEPDVITVHHRNYYRDGSEPPADWDSPTPIPFLSAKAKFLLALAGPPTWVNATFEILRLAFSAMGIGAKTSSGYGRLAVEAPNSNPSASYNDSEILDLVQRVRALKTDKVPGSIRQFADQCVALETPAHRRRVAEAIVSKVREVRKEKRWQDQGWYKELLKIVGGKTT